MERIAEITRKTGETDIQVKLNIDGTGSAKIDCPVGFVTHMLTTFARHGLFDIELTARGDLEVDQHHLVEDIGIVLGQAFAKALGDKGGINRVGSCLFPMDETLARAAVDLSGRPYLVFEANLSGLPLVSTEASFQTDTVEDFWLGFATNAACALHLDILRGRSDHHKIEALFKAAARAMREACSIDNRSLGQIPSTKGVLA
ncbi:imidazoleglycerol-phosphate dehydratase HisB [Gracilinema caldarium]|uniref:Imidazoleglycerol-phosphate dehydratase n=1 Tax=Gracilinema caldarium (strain ATCC 51460 / DSM 7334 / H1) TaxID=744872 RepID=F8F495_GRAC1|nr:imidazoleglycerol-phosphate dehydratase HisB [Gracilinema caldarium]AEJ20542.1 Imidazoleglycerol-phosphate dehydratase [Gracilinema caldarium DSM 7334]